jgi:hypothetical protein
LIVIEIAMAIEIFLFPVSPSPDRNEKPGAKKSSFFLLQKSDQRKLFLGLRKTLF